MDFPVSRGQGQPPNKEIATGKEGYFLKSAGRRKVASGTKQKLSKLDGGALIE